MINRNSSFIEERRNLICDTLHTTGITCEQVIEGIMWKQATNGIPRPRQRNWRKSSVAITNSIRILVFFSLFLSLSFLFSSTDGNFSSHDALACPIPRWFNRGRGVSLLFRPWSLESSNLVHWITRRPAVINEIFCNLWPSSRCWRSTQLRSIYSYRERRRWAKLIFIYLKKKKKKKGKKFTRC